MGAWGLVTAISLGYAGVFFVFGFMFVSVLIYFVIRSRDRAGELQDPQIGVKFALNFLMSVTIFIWLGGATAIVVDVASRMFGDQKDFRLSPSSQFKIRGRRPPAQRRSAGQGSYYSDTVRTGLGLLLGGMLLTALNAYLLYSRTNQRKWPLTLRMFSGARLIVHGLIFSIAFAVAWAIGFQSEMSGQSAGLASALATTTVWATAFGIDFVLLKLATASCAVPGSNYFCGDCGTDLRQFAETAVCPRCESAVSMPVRRALNALHIPV